jgi:hypothetical protein
MFTVDDLFTQKNQQEAFAYLAKKKYGIGEEGISALELEEYWKLNGAGIREEIREGKYEPGIIKCTESVNKSGERQIVSDLSSIDYFIIRAGQCIFQRKGKNCSYHILSRNWQIHLL